jgi:sugar phosphate isomerase/epimerase
MHDSRVNAISGGGAERAELTERIEQAGALRFGAGADDLRLPPRDAVEALRRAGFRHIELNAAGDLAPRELTATGRRHLSRFLRATGVTLTALGVTAPHRSVEEQIDAATAGIEMAGELGADVAAVSLSHLGVRGDALSTDVLSTLECLVDRADLTGRVLVLEPGPLDSAATVALIHRLGHPSVRALVDPGRLVADGRNARDALLKLADHVGLARVRDALPGTPQHAGRETPLGEGAVDFDEYLALLRDFGYRRPTLIRRGESDRPLADLIAARDLLARAASRIAGS